MTDEERTDELIQKAKESYKVYSEDKCVDTYEGYQYIDGYCNGYEQGYEDCRHYAHDYYKPKWHDLRKDPNDLPKENGKYIIHIKVSGKITITDTCDFFNGYFGQYINPTAWCELPKFEE